MNDEIIPLLKECDSSQVLTMRDARLIIRTSLEDGVLHSRYAAEDVTQRFAVPCAAPNGGPATQLGNSGVAKGPPSVS